MSVHVSNTCHDVSTTLQYFHQADDIIWVLSEIPLKDHYAVTFRIRCVLYYMSKQFFHRPAVTNPIL
jgi:hypothetical protein